MESNINKYFGELTLLGSIQRVIMTMAQVLSDYADFDVVIDKLIKEKGYMIGRSQAIIEYLFSKGVGGSNL